MKDFETLTKLSKNWGKIIVATGIEKLPKVQINAQSGHIGRAGICSRY